MKNSYLVHPEGHKAASEGDRNRDWEKRVKEHSCENNVHEVSINVRHIKFRTLEDSTSTNKNGKVTYSLASA